MSLFSPSKWEVKALVTISAQLANIERKLNKMAVSQEQFDSDLAALVTAVGNLISAVDALIANTPKADLTAEDKSVATAAASVQAELDKITPPAP